VREIAEAAKVKPNTFVRMARRSGSKATRISASRSARRSGRARPVFRTGRAGCRTSAKAAISARLYADMVERDLATSRRPLPPSTSSVEAAAEAIWAARQVFTLGVGVNNANASNFTYLASTGMVRVPRHPAVRHRRHRRSRLGRRTRRADRDDLQALPPRGGRGRRIAREQGLTVIGVSDSPAEPDHRAPSSASSWRRHAAVLSVVGRDHRLLETLLSFVIAVASDEIVERVERFHRRRHELGIYTGGA
jgi:hypothetical protein